MRGANVGADDGRTLTVRVALQFQTRGGRKQIVAPDGESLGPPRRRIDNTMVKAIARAFRWRKLIEIGRYQTIEEIAAAEKINPSYVCRVLRLTLLAPGIVEAILAGRQHCSLTLGRLMRPFPLEWNEQLSTLSTCNSRGANDLSAERCR
ncbi:MAG: hypothetical protein Q8M31_12775 [Beijerinckiaceae bacterium]|nr:hypothetical protein [Beijerinckiaceae bacterium]